MGGRGSAGRSLPATPEERVRRAYSEIAARLAAKLGPDEIADRGGQLTISLASIRSHRFLRGLSREEQDETLRRLARAPDVFITTELMPYNLTERERAGAVTVGGHLRHSITVSQPAGRETSGRSLPAPGPASGQAPRPIGAQIRDAVIKALVRRGEKGAIDDWDGTAWVSMPQLRAELPDIPRADLDAALIAATRDRDIVITADADERRLTAEDRAAAVRIGGEDHHLIKLRIPKEWD
jgi:hypothetical protein